MRLRFKPFILFAAATLLLVLPASYVLTEGRHKADDEQSVRILTMYLRAIYSRDFKHAYRVVSAEDKRLQEEQVYVRERVPFAGFVVGAAKKLAEFLEFRPAQVKIDH